MELLIKTNFLLQFLWPQRMSFEPRYVFLIPSMPTECIWDTAGNGAVSTSTRTSNDVCCSPGDGELASTSVGVGGQQ